MNCEQSRSRQGIFILLATPIGNLGDLSQRAIEALKNADIIAAEDSRRLRVLLSYLQIGRKDILSIDANKEHSSAQKIVELVSNGNNVVYTSDAGMPGISDPGSVLVRSVLEAGLKVDAIPGPSASVLAVALSGMGEHGFLFAGFLPVKPGPRRRELHRLEQSGVATVIFESPNRAAALLEAASEVYGSQHRVFVGRELTKLYQELYLGELKEAVEHFKGLQKGEFVVVLDGKERVPIEEENLKLVDALIEVLSDPSRRTKDAAEQIALISGVSKSHVYEKLVNVKVRFRQANDIGGSEP